MPILKLQHCPVKYDDDVRMEQVLQICQWLQQLLLVQQRRNAAGMRHGQPWQHCGPPEQHGLLRVAWLALDLARLPSLYRLDGVDGEQVDYNAVDENILCFVDYIVVAAVAVAW